MCTVYKQSLVYLDGLSYSSHVTKLPTWTKCIYFAYLNEEALFYLGPRQIAAVWEEFFILPAHTQPHGQGGPL